MKNRDKNGRFSPGKSGNPSGRPRNELSALRKKLTESSDEILQVVRTAALNGDLQACKMILDRVCPPLKAQAAPMEVDLPSDSDITQLGESFIRAAADGRVPLDLTAQLLGAISHLARVSEVRQKLDEVASEPELINKIQIEVIDSNNTKGEQT